ncbi:hypothetical protein BUALT_Bualt05G0123700 [Buddleja alternifolia]|uniref:Wall-associated receptor kinase C-terminal domain-containing protein n=1 Tax=Buddleja alternifolia TaxID=168488 RepID=A0AAV6XN04_9LAMI|nr:hypothetical protein BUALT_Bualt05G0123700 [Buddleja alternifolia]
MNVKAKDDAVNLMIGMQVLVLGVIQILYWLNYAPTGLASCRCQGQERRLGTLHQKYFVETLEKFLINQMSNGMMVLEIVGEWRNVDPQLADTMSEAYFPHWVHKHLEVNVHEEDHDVLNLRGDDFVVEDIFYKTKSLRVSDPAFSSLNSSAGCVPRITVNTTLPGLRYEFVGNVTTLHLFSNCTNSSLSEGRLRYCNAEDRNDWVLPLYENSENFTNALESCGRNVVVPVEEHVEDENLGRGSVVEVLRRGFVLNWTVSDCSECTSSGGRCGFNETTYRFWCFCPDRPHALSCKSRKFVFFLVFLSD